jgi:hypothetical protein
LVCFAALVALVAAFYAEEDWRGRRDWNQYRAAIEARGESLDFKTYIPKPVPDDQNFLATPFLKSFYPTNGDQRPLFILTNDLWARAFVHVAETYGQKDRSHRHFTDLVAWQKASEALQNGPLNARQSFETTNTSLAARAAAAPAVLEGMEPDATVFAELRAASTRKYSLCPVAYDLENPGLSLGNHLAGMKQLCQRLDLEASAELAAGQSGQSLADVKLMLSLAESFKSDPYLISYLVRLSCYQIVTQPVWEGLAEHRWTDAQLQELQSRFLACDFLGDLNQALKADRAFGVLRCDEIKKKGLELVADEYALNSASSFAQSSPPAGVFNWLRKLMPAKWSSAAASSSRRTPPTVLFKWIGRLMPSGWYDLEKVNYCRQFEDKFKGFVDFAAKRVSPRQAPPEVTEDNDQFHESQLQDVLHHLVTASTLTGLARSAFNASRSQTCANQIALACALERYRLANGQFPDTLDALTPRFIAHAPNDLITGQSYKYRRTANGQFVLYSVGWNEKDDGGVPGKELFDKTQGDWVWEYPPE